MLMKITHASKVRKNGYEQWVTKISYVNWICHRNDPALLLGFKPERDADEFQIFNIEIVDNWNVRSYFLPEVNVNHYAVYYRVKYGKWF